MVTIDLSKELNYFLVKVFNQILCIEEDRLKTGEFKNLSVRETHVIEAVADAQKSGNNRSSDIAQALNISAGTLTTAVKLLDRKGYILRKKDAHDKRIVRIYLTEKGGRADLMHQAFHEKMIDDVLAVLSSEEVEVLVRGLKSLESFFLKNK